MTTATNAVGTQPKIKHIVVNRQQLCWTALDLDHLIGENHAARVIWGMVQRVDLSKFEEKVASWEGDGGRPCWPAVVLVSVVVYGYSLGVASAREMERLQKHEPGMRWLCADQTINHHTISDFRVRHEDALMTLFAQLLGVLSKEGLVDLGTVMLDGTKMEAVASKASYHRRETLESHIKQARQALKQLRGQSEQQREEQDKRRQAARQRAARERVERMQRALKELKALEKVTKESERETLRVSETEAEARKMKTNQGGWNLGYNVQVSTEASHMIVVGVEVTKEATDVQQLVGALKGVEGNLNAKPKQLVADKGYASRDNVEKMEKAEVEFIAPWKDDKSREAGACKTNEIDLEFAGSTFQEHADGDGLQCKAGKKLVRIREKVHHKQLRVIYEAAAKDCEECEWRVRCCGKRGKARRVERVKESAAMEKYLKRMAEPATQEIYKKRKSVAEFPHLWMKVVLGLRRFSVRGPTKVKMEATWIAISHNISRWMSALTRRQAKAEAAA